MSKKYILIVVTCAIFVVVVAVAFTQLQESGEGALVFATEPLTDDQNITQDPACCDFHGQTFIGYEQKDGTFVSIFVGRLSGNSMAEVEELSVGGDNADPHLITWNEQLCLLWSTNATLSTEGKDWDIAVRAFDGANWGNVTDISSWSKYEESDDSLPKAAVYSDQLHVIWENESSILHRSIEPTGEMSQVLEVGRGWGADIEAFDDGLYIAWTTHYDSETGDSSVLLRRFIYDAWEDEIISVNPNIGYLDYYPSVEGFENRLYIAWVTKDKAISTGEGDDDIVIRCYDPALGNIDDQNAWSPVTELSGAEEDWDDWPLLHSHSGELYAIWQTWNLATNDGDIGDDLVLRRLDEDGWCDLIKITDRQRQDGALYETGFSAMSSEGKLKIFFQSRGQKLSGNDWQVWMGTSNG